MLFWIIILLAIGLTALYKGADLVVNNASSLAVKMGVSTVAVGLSIVAVATVLPELSVAIMASWHSAGDLIIGNALGTTIFNIGIILGLAALISPIAVQRSTLRHEFPWLLLYGAVIYYLAYDLVIDRADGILLIFLAVVFIWYSIKESRKEPLLEDRRIGGPILRSTHSWRHIFLGLALIILGAKLFVDSALYLAQKFDLSQFLVGLLIIAIGTSLPELAVTLTASARHRAGVGIGNIIGSNTLNVFFIVGIAALIRPIIIHPDLLIFDFPMVIFFAILVSLLFKTHHRLTRFEGAVLVGGYIFYLVYSLKFWG